MVSVTTAVQPTEVSEPASTQPVAPLTTWLSAPVETVEENVSAFVTALQSTHVPPEERELVATALLRMLSADGPRNRTVRRACVEAVLQLGYPWALQLEPDDVTDAREAAQAARPTSRWRRALIIVSTGTLLGVGVIGGALAFWSQLLDQPTLPTPVVVQVPPKPVEVTPPTAVMETAAKVAQLRAHGDFDQAVGLAEGCAMSFETPKPCLEQLSALASDAAARNNDDFERYAARQWAVLANEPDAALVHEHGRTLLSTNFARDASFLPPLSELDGQLLMAFIGRSMQLEHEGGWRTLASNASNCVDSGGQVGAVCRAFFLRAQEQQLKPPLTRPADRPPSPSSRVAEHVRRIIDLRVQDRLDDAIDEANLCVKLPLATDCQSLLADALARRYRDRLNPSDKQREELWREALRTAPRRELWAPKTTLE